MFCNVYFAKCSSDIYTCHVLKIMCAEANTLRSGITSGCRLHVRQRLFRGHSISNCWCASQWTGRYWLHVTCVPYKRSRVTYRQPSCARPLFCQCLQGSCASGNTYWGGHASICYITSSVSAFPSSELPAASASILSVAAELPSPLSHASAISQCNVAWQQ